jgi:hypothetical protein
MYGNTSSSPTNRAIGGATLASEILKTFRLLVADKNSTSDQIDTSYPLTLYFGEPDTMMSLLSLMMLDSISSDFKATPPYGSALVFELFSSTPDASGEMLTDPSDLWIRFSFQNGTSDFDDEKLVSYPMFNSGRSMSDMSWSTFQELFAKIGMESVGQWCTSCNSGSSFCRGADGSGVTLVVPTAHAMKAGMSPAVAGVIGAVVSLFVAGLLFAAGMLLGGIRLHHVERNNKSQLGGFKGSRKLASDPDLSLANNGAQPAGGIAAIGGGKRGHERVKSWELWQNEWKGKDFGHKRGDSEDSFGGGFGAIDDVTSRPVETHQRV